MTVNPADTPPEASALEGCTAVIAHRVRDDKQSEYENWLQEIGPLCQSSPGYLDWQIVRPIAGITETYTVIIRFDTREHLQQWMESPVRRRLIEQVQVLLVRGDTYTIHSGLDFWFTPSGGSTRVPVRWKQFLITWSAIYPLVLAVPPIIVPALRWLGGSGNHYINTLIVTATIVFLMVYVVMPCYTKLVQRWLFE